MLNAAQQVFAALAFHVWRAMQGAGKCRTVSKAVYGAPK